MEDKKENIVELRKTIEILTKQLKKVKGTDIHFVAENVLETQNLTATVSVYDNIKPSHKVLEELTEWARDNNPEVYEKIKALQADMSWNPKI